jgi:hypothetical protein
MKEDCPDCGHELVDVAETIQQDLVENDKDVLESVSEILGYYCSDCSDFYNATDLKAAP